MNSDELRAAFLRFFDSKDHKVIPSSSLIPHGDPTLLLTTAGMVQIKPYFLGEAVPPSPRLASCQKCFRTTDIESVGDSNHLTFFEMLGNFSVGNYFKKEAINWAWEFVTEWLKLPAQHLWITVFLDDDEAFQYWHNVGVPEERILRFGEEDNFWGPAGDSGPCGPCSEILYDFGKDVGCKKASCAPGCDCGRFSEIWNLVFTQYNQDKEGNRTPLPKPNIDTGMGLERTAAVMQGKTSIYETELFTSLIENISKFTGKNYGSDAEVDKAIRVVVEHGRALTFLIADGVMPSNEGRGYVLRRLLRRAALFGRRLGLEKPFLNQIAGTTVGSMARVYPELQQRQSFIYQVVGTEEAQFRETLNTGLELLDGIIEKARSKQQNRISGEEAFKLYDTYGFPVELTKEIADEHGFSVDLEGFEREMEKQRERAREAQKFGTDIPLWLRNAPSSWLSRPLSKKTEFLGYKLLEQNTSILNLLVDNNSVETVQKGQETSLILETTPFYGEMGGQVGDTGEIRGSTGRFLVTNTIRVPHDIIVHQGRVTEGSLSIGDKVIAEVDRERRLDIARNHTATHLLQAALRQVLGEHIQQRGSLVAPDRFRFDFSHLTAMTKEEKEEVQHIVNEKIRQNLAVYDEDIPYKKAIEEGAIALFDEKYGDVVRVIRIGRPPISTELCGGTHITTTGEIGFFHIIGESSIGSGLRRIEAVTGKGADEYISQRLSDLHKLAEYLDTEPDSVLDKAHSLSTELKNERRQTLALERELSKKIAESLLNQAEVVKGVRVLVAKVPPSRIQALLEMSDLLREQLKSVVVVLGTVYEDKPAFLAAVTPDLVTKGYNAGEIVKRVAAVTGGSGGGKATLAQAGGKHKDKLDEALRLVKGLI
ncbi:alanine--tRNA ligase [Chloroflexota bacterium]